MKKKYVAIATAAMCMAGTVNYTAFAASTFTDINDVPWSGAAQYIDEAASLGLMAGYTENGNKLCKAKNNVTYCEAVQLIYSTMCLNDSTQKVSSSVVSKWTSAMQSADIPTWAYDSVAYCLENSVLSTNDIAIFVTSGTQNNARREDVAVIFGKALSKLYTVNTSASLTYNDKSSVSSTSVPYLELLNRLNLMVGDSGNNFNPKAYINRAEMAVLASKTYNKIKGSSTPTPVPTPTVEQFTGTVKEVTTSGNDTVITVDVSGTNKTFTVTSSATVIKDDVASSASKINEGDTVVVVSSNNVTTFVTVLYSSNSSSCLSGTISSITTKKISIKTDSKTTSYSFESRYTNTVVKFDGSSSDVDELIKAYKDGDTISAKITLGSDGYVSRIDATTEDSQLEGTLTSLTSSKLELKYNSKTYTYNLPDDTDDITVTVDGSSSTYSKLKSKYSSTTYTVKVTIDSDKEISKIVATSKSSSSTVSGDLYSISSSSIKVTKSDGTKETYSIDSSVTVTIDGSTSKLSTLISRVDDDKDYTVKLTITDDKVTKIAATLSDGTSSSDTVKGTLVDLDEENGVRVKVSGSSTSKWYLWASSGYEIKLNGSYSNIDKVLNKKDDETVTVTLTLNGADRVTKLTATSSDEDDADELEGTISSLSSSKISIKLDDGTKKTHNLADSVTVKVNGSTKSISKLEDYIEDGTYYATLTLNSDDEVKTINADEAKSTRIGILKVLDDDTIKVQVDSVVYSYDLASSVTVKVDGDDMDLDEFIDKYVLNTYEVTLSRNSSGNVTKIIATKK